MIRILVLTFGYQDYKDSGRAVILLYHQLCGDNVSWQPRKRCEPCPVFLSGKWPCAIGEKQERLSFPDSFSLVLSFGGAKERTYN